MGNKTPKKTRKKEEEKFEIVFEPDPSIDEYPIVVVKWNDSFVEADWKLIDEIVKDGKVEPATITTVGFLIHDDKDHKIIAGSVYGCQTTNRMIIPTACILSMEKIDI